MGQVMQFLPLQKKNEVYGKLGFISERHKTLMIKFTLCTYCMSPSLNTRVPVEELKHNIKLLYEIFNIYLPELCNTS